MELVPDPARLEYDLGPRNDMATITRNAIKRLYAKLLDGDDISCRVGLTGHVLMDDAIPYACARRVAASISQTPGPVGPDHRAHLTRRLRWRGEPAAQYVHVQGGLPGSGQ